jgi:hypothetical protein
MEKSNFSSTHVEGEIMAIVTVGIDLAKNVFAVHGVDESGKPALVPSGLDGVLWHQPVLPASPRTR